MREGELESFEASLNARLTRIYGDRGAAVVDRILSLVADFSENAAKSSADSSSLWSERDVVLITYGWQVQSHDHAPLVELRRFLVDHGLDNLLSTVHLLPFFPYSSDDGFSVIDFRQVDPKLGDWADVHSLCEHFDLMFDLVLNHVSRRNDWFTRYQQGEPPYDRFFIEADPAIDLSATTRPRSHPLLTSVETSRGERSVWTTFSDDQVDLNYDEPEVLVQMLQILLNYVRHGARIIRLDAIAYLWKEIGTPCIHRPQTHEVVKLMRDVLSVAAPQVLLLTETNVPHDENVSYLGDGDEAHMVYQFSLPPLLLDGFHSGDASTLTNWLDRLGQPPEGTTYFNFTASHDGIGVRPLEGLVATDRFERLLDAVRARGGHVSTRRTPSGKELPYELNISYVDALGGSGDDDLAKHARRFLTSQGVMLALRGIPGVYFHSLVGTGNDVETVATTRRLRSINRRKFERSEIDRRLEDESSLEGRIYRGYAKLLETRIAQPAFHPNGAQTVLRLADGVLAFSRTSCDGEQHVVTLANLRSKPVDVDLAPVAHLGLVRDLLDDTEKVASGRILLLPHQLAWLTNTR